VASEFIDWDTLAVRELAVQLAKGNASDAQIAGACFHFVRDEIAHTCDAQSGPVTIRASEVLRHRTGFCYAKSHLLAALLRANGIPAALCYQRLSIDGTGHPFCLHGLNAIHLQGIGWYRVDARGNKPGVDAQFDPPFERLAFTLGVAGEFDIPGRFVAPLPEVTAALRHATNWQDLLANLPDQEQ
jgi:transglutaminase-like putative cysteine protease